VTRFSLKPIPDSELARADLLGAMRTMLSIGGFEGVVEREVNGDYRKLMDVMMSIEGLNVKMTMLDKEQRS
jgi:hypothetical protein